MCIGQKINLRLVDTPAMLPFKEVRVLDINAEHAGTPMDTLMENAGYAFAQAVVEAVGKDKRIAIICGVGNNGGDGFVAARYLLETNKPTVILTDLPGDIRTDAARKNFERVKHIASSAVGVSFSKFDVIVDAMLGTGTYNDVREPYRTLINRINESGAYIIALDVPSGLGTDIAIKPRLTVTFHDVKEGMTQSNSGKIIIRPIGIPQDAERYVGPGEFIYYPGRDKDSHKGENGKILIVGGGPFTGAPALSGLAACRMGVDLVHISTPWMSYGPIASYSPNLIVHRLSDEVLVEEDVETVLSILQNVDAVLFGPGLGNDERTMKAVRSLVRDCDKPMVIDADAIHAVAKDVTVLKGKTAVITPHAKEFQVLTGKGLPKDFEERVPVITEAAKELGVVILAKGRVDVVSDGYYTKLNRTGNAGMSVGGTGDVLAGEVVALLSRNVSAFNAARISAFTNGTAGDIAFEKLGYSIMATDVIDHIPDVIKRYAKRMA